MTAAAPPAMLELARVTAGYGQFTALWDVDLRVSAGEAVAVVGPNGAGKTTLMRVISGLVPARTGRLTFEGADLGGVPAHDIVEHGIAHVPEGRRIFPALSVADNLKMGAFRPAARRAYRESLDRVHALFPALAERRGQRAGSLSGGEQQMLAIGRALMALPKLLLLDEPSLGLAPVVVDLVFDALAAVSGAGIGVLVVEQDVERALTACSRGYLLVEGRVIAAGTTAELRDTAEVRQRVLGM